LEIFLHDESLKLENFDLVVKYGKYPFKGSLVLFIIRKKMKFLLLAKLHVHVAEGHAHESLWNGAASVGSAPTIFFKQRLLQNHWIYFNLW